jgi:hypothetical protein
MRAELRSLQNFQFFTAVGSEPEGFRFLRRFLSVVVGDFLQDDNLFLFDASVGCCD